MAPFYGDGSLVSGAPAIPLAGDIRARVSETVSDDGIRATSLIARAFSSAPAFTPTKVLVASW